MAEPSPLRPGREVPTFQPIVGGSDEPVAGRCERDSRCKNSTQFLESLSLNISPPNGDFPAASRCGKTGIRANRNDWIPAEVELITNSELFVLP